MSSNSVPTERVCDEPDEPTRAASGVHASRGGGVVGVLRSASKPGWAAMMPPSVCVHSGLSGLSVSADSWFYAGACF
jgi:hypothetical protein